MTIEPGRRFDNVDDDVVAAYINAGDHTTQQGQFAKVIIAGAQQWPALNSWTVHVRFLQLPYNVLEVELPIDQETTTDLNNDVLRVLYVHLSNDSPSIPSTVTDASVAESRRHVLRELERRGFTAKLPAVPRLRGRNNASAYRPSTAPDPLPGLASGPQLAKSVSVDQLSSEAKTRIARKLHVTKDSSDDDPRQQVARGLVSISTYLFGEVSETKKGKASVTGETETDSSDHSSVASSSNTVIHEFEDSSSEDDTPRNEGGSATDNAIFREESGDSSEGTKLEAIKTPVKHRNSLSDQKSDY